MGRTHSDEFREQVVTEYLSGERMGDISAKCVIIYGEPCVNKISGWWDYKLFGNVFLKTDFIFNKKYKIKGKGGCIL